MASRRQYRTLSIGSTVWRMACGYVHVPAEARSSGRNSWEGNLAALIDWNSTWFVIKLSVACLTKWSTLNIRHQSTMLEIRIQYTIANQICRTIGIVRQSFCHNLDNVRLLLCCVTILVTAMLCEQMKRPTLCHSALTLWWDC